MNALHHGKTLRFVWWNPADFRHYDASRVEHERWPQSHDEYDAKLSRVTAAFAQMTLKYGPISLIALCETTRKAAMDLRDRQFPGYHILSLDLLSDSEPNVAYIYDPQLAWETVNPIAAMRVPRDTRAMAVLDMIGDGFRIRFIACHWPPKFGSTQEVTRRTLASTLTSHIYGFLNNPNDAIRKSVVVLGDLNVEPFEITDMHLIAHRSRARTLGRPHFSDADVERVHLYDCAWRLLGESAPHRGGGELSVAGTHYWFRERSWHTVDHVIVSAGLLGNEAPFLDEASISVALPEACFTSGNIAKFAWSNGKAQGLSDHLPITGALILKENSNGRL